MLSRLWRAFRAEKIVREHTNSRVLELDRTTKALKQAEKRIANGVTVKFLKAVHKNG